MKEKPSQSFEYMIILPHIYITPYDMTTITRLGYCENCAKEHRPKTGQEFLAQGSSHREPKIMRAARNGRAGFVPHLYKITGFDQLRHKVYYQRLCCMSGCGTYTYDTKTHHCLDRCEEKWSTILTTRVSNWNALVLFKDTGFTI